MRDAAVSSPLLLCLLVIVFGAMASLVPMSPIEPVLVGAAAVAPAWLLLPLIALATASHMSTKMLVFLGGAKIEGALTGKSRERFDRARVRFAGNRRLQHGTLFLSSVTGLPPFYLMTALCGTMRMPKREFLLLASTGRAIRFTVLVLMPQLLRPATAAAQVPPAAVRVAGEGRQTYVLLSGMVGGTGGLRRLERRLVEQGNRVVSMDPYQLAVDSTNVTFHAMARLVDAELGARNISGAIIVGHSHGGGVALRLAANAPERVAALYLLDVGAMPSNGGAVFGSALKFVSLIARMPAGKAFIRHRILAGIRANTAGDQWLDAESGRAYTEPLLDNIDRVVAMALRLATAAEPEPVSAVVARIRAPMTLLLGETRTTAGPFDEEIRVLAMSGVRLQVDTIRRAGHFPHEEAPDAVATAIGGRRLVAIAGRPVRP